MKKTSNHPVNGLHKEFFAGGELSGEGRFRNGKHHGKWKYYYRNGQLKAVGKYVDGTLDGHWQWWRENGKPLQAGAFVSDRTLGKIELRLSYPDWLANCFWHGERQIPPATNGFDAEGSLLPPNNCAHLPGGQNVIPGKTVMPARSVQRVLAADVLSFQARPFALWQPEKQFILIEIPNDKRWGAPLDDIRFDPFHPNMLTKYANLVVVESDKHATVSGTMFRQWLDLIENQLESEPTDFKYEYPTLLFMLPLQREAQRFGVETERTLGVFDKEHTPREKIVHDCCLAVWADRVRVHRSYSLHFPRSTLPTCNSSRMRDRRTHLPSGPFKNLTT